MQNQKQIKDLVKVTQNLSGNMLPSGLLVVHNTSRGSKDNISKLSGREKIVNPRLNFANTNIETGRNDSSLVDTTVKLNNNLTSTMVVNKLKVANVT